MKDRKLLCRMGVVILALGTAGTVGVRGARQAKAQGMRLGSAVAHADHAEAEISGASFLLSGRVTVETPDGQSIASDTIRLTMATNPVTKKNDVASAVAEGNVRFKTTRNIAAPNTPPQMRTVQGSSDNATWKRFDGMADLTGNVTVSVDDPVKKMVWRNAGSAVIDLKSGKVKADKAPNGPQMLIEAISKVPPAPKKITK